MDLTQVEKFTADGALRPLAYLGSPAVRAAGLLCLPVFTLLSTSRSFGLSQNEL